ncbi:MAG: (Fe-S)-binding protein [Woeseiaceae bacterium]|nr:(Fe-S)-binding protein [Woeseiaceae bacterium]
METTNHVTAIFYLAAAVALLVFAYNLRGLAGVRIGKPETHRKLQPLSQLGNALFFGVGQGRVNNRRFTYASVMHFCLGWGFIELVFATTVGFFTARDLLTGFLPGMDVPWFAALNDLGGLLLFIGLVMALGRRYLSKPEALPQDAFKGRGHLLGDTGILLFLVLIVVGGFLSEAARLAIERPETAAFSFVGYSLSGLASADAWTSLEPSIWWGHALTSFAFIAVLPLTKMFHAVAAIANVAVTDRERRGLVRPMHVSAMMEDPDADLDNLALGASKSQELTWKQLLDAVACTECARCTTVCPAHAAERPLSPMNVITDLRHDLYHETLGRGEARQLVGERVTADALWSCTTCGACMDVCPVLIEHVPTFTDMRRYLVMSEGSPPDKGGEALEAMMSKGNPWGLPARNRTEWATSAGIELPLMKQKKQADVLYWVGCAGAYDPRNQEVARAMVRLFEAAGIDYGVLGDEETCTGDSARRMGDEYGFETMAMQNIETFGKYEFNKIVTPCPHCFHTIANEYPDFDGRFEVEHHSDFIDGLIRSGKLSPQPKNGSVMTFHDPCYLGRHNQVYDSPRSVLSAASGNELREMSQSRRNSFCCGAGGGNMWYEVEEKERINLQRLRQARETGADTIAVGCSFCMIMMEDAVRVANEEDAVRVRDIAEVVADTLSTN